MRTKPPSHHPDWEEITREFAGVDATDPYRLFGDELPSLVRKLLIANENPGNSALEVAPDELICIVAAKAELPEPVRKALEGLGARLRPARRGRKPRDAGEDKRDRQALRYYDRVRPLLAAMPEDQREKCLRKRDAGAVGLRPSDAAAVLALARYYAGKNLDARTLQNRLTIIRRKL